MEIRVLLYIPNLVVKLVSSEGVAGSWLICSDRRCCQFVYDSQVDLRCFQLAMFFTTTTSSLAQPYMDCSVVPTNIDTHHRCSFHTLSPRENLPNQSSQSSVSLLACLSGELAQTTFLSCSRHCSGVTNDDNDVLPPLLNFSLDLPVDPSRMALGFSACFRIARTRSRAAALA